MVTATIDADSDSNGVRTAVEASWAVARTAAGTATTNFITQASSGPQLGRYFAFFDLVSIPTGSTISTAKMVHPSVANKLSTAGGSIHIVEHVATDPIGTGDMTSYKTLNGDTSFGSETYANVSTGGTFDITINASGITYLTTQIGSIAKIGLRSSHDIDNSAPGGGLFSQYTCSVTAHDLVIDYVPPPGFFAIL